MGKKKFGLRNKESGVTLVEMLIVMAILVVIIGISTNGIILQQKKSRDARRKADLETVRAALERYRMEAPPPTGYPEKISNNYDLDTYGPTISPYLNRPVPQDPKSGRKYQVDLKPGSYSLQAAMEYDLITPPACPQPTGILSCNGASPSCTYCVNNP